MKHKYKHKKSTSFLLFGAVLSGLFLVTVSAVNAGYTRDIVFPVDGENHFFNDFAAPRDGGAREHEAIDIIAKKMTPVVAAVDGRVRYIVRPEATWGYAIFLEDSDGWQYRYLHLNNDTPGTDDGNGGEQYAYAPGIDRGTQVTAGQLLGWVGDSGNAEYTAAHLHFEIRDPQGTAINPYESLIAARPVGTVAGTNSSGEPVTTVIIIARGGELIKYAADPKVYYLVNDIKQHIADEASFRAMGFSFTDVRVLPESESYRSGLPIRLENGAVAVYEDGTPLVDDGVSPDVSTGYVFTRDLQIGSEGQEVSELQRVLKQLGHFTYPSITGYYGSVTADAVRSFQISKGISPVGIVGPQTRAALNSL